MKAATIVGKTVKAVEQRRYTTAYGEPVYHVEVIVFTDGTRLVLSGKALEYEAIVEGATFKNGKRL